MTIDIRYRISAKVLQFGISVPRWHGRDAVRRKWRNAVIGFVVTVSVLAGIGWVGNAIGGKDAAFGALFGAEFTAVALFVLLGVYRHKASRPLSEFTDANPDSFLRIEEGGITTGRDTAWSWIDWSMLKEVWRTRGVIILDVSFGRIVLPEEAVPDYDAFEAEIMAMRQAALDGRAPA